jgi:hypothetical protein
LFRPKAKTGECVSGENDLIKSICHNQYKPEISEKELFTTTNLPAFLSVSPSPRSKLKQKKVLLGDFFNAKTPRDAEKMKSF